jgi:hypothetical protein
MIKFRLQTNEFFPYGIQGFDERKTEAEIHLFPMIKVVTSLTFITFPKLAPKISWENQVFIQDILASSQ